jgi:hypothetical protein
VESCPNIGGGEIRRRLSMGYLGLILTIAVIVFTIIFDPGQLRALVFVPALLMGITFFEAWDKTCIISAYFGIKNLGQKNQREKNHNSLIIQRTQSVKIIIKSIITDWVR